jgi:hypothetical protein
MYSVLFGAMQIYKEKQNLRATNRLQTTDKIYDFQTALIHLSV